MIKHLIIKEFDHFSDHRMVISEEADPLFGKNLVALTGQKWKDMRATLSPAFTGTQTEFFHNNFCIEIVLIFQGVKCVKCLILSAQ
jgi:cytochrome P450 family 9